jgi:hypothetical protein
VKRIAMTAAVLAVAAMVAAAPVAAQQRLRVLLVVDQADDPFAERIRAELAALGLDVVALETWRTGESIESLDAAGRSESAAAAIRMLSSRRGVEVWMANQPTGRSLLRQLIVDESSTGPNLGLVALQTAELLRTSLLSVADARAATAARQGSAPPKAETAVPVVEAKSAGPAPWGVQAAFGAMFSPASGDGQMQAWLSVQRLVVGRLGIALDGSLPLSTGTVTGPEGSARINSALGGLALFSRFDASERPVYATLAVGGAVIRVDADGDASEPFIASSDSAVTGAAYARGDAGFAATNWLRFGLRAVAGVAPTGVKVRFAGNEAGVWGRPFLAGFVVTDLAW